ncbi:MAG: tRNA pseudouridine(55) synthase TruB [Bacteroidales bacterium]|nr:tRNA pseudouridine(55) synthase TruB [Bacteroidales bacterium]
MAEPYFLLEGCPVDGMAEFLESHLSGDIADYPGGIVIPMDKPLRWTSADLVRKVKFQAQRLFHDKKLKVGHAGTLDPLASGMLIICLGKATKIAEELQSHEKEYVTTVEFGASTASYDLEQPVDSFYPYEHITRESVEAALKDFIGEQEQVPPIFSAKIVGGLRAYEYARAGEPVELKRSIITIKEIEILDWHEAGTRSISEEERKGPEADFSQIRHIHNYHTAETASDGSRPAVTLRIRCTKGTYIRSIARDLGLALGSGAYLTALRRTASGPFRLG